MKTISGTGMWVIRTDEPQESVEDPVRSPAPRPTSADEADPEGLGDSLAELPEARVVRTPGQAKEILRAGEDLREPQADTAAAPARVGVAYPEWDFRSAAYRRPGAMVRESAPAARRPPLGEGGAGAPRALLRRVRSRFERLRPRRVPDRPSARRPRARHCRIRPRSSPMRAPAFRWRTASTSTCGRTP